jgi:hypothetical protein
VPSIVLVESEIVGLGLVDQTTPLAKTGLPPSDVTFPPEIAELGVILLTAVVKSNGRFARDVKVTSLPYPVPEIFVA